MTIPNQSVSQHLTASGIIQTVGLVKIGVMALPDVPGVAGVVLDAVGSRGINVPFVVELADHEQRSHIVFCVQHDRLNQALDALNEVAGRVRARQIVHQAGVALVAVYGPHFRDRPGGAAQAFAAIAAAGVNILAISTSVSSICCVVEESRLATVVAALQTAFDVSDSGLLVSAPGLSRLAKRGRSG